MPRIIHSVALHPYLRGFQILLTFSMHQVMFSVFCVVPCVEVVCEEFFLIQHHCKEQSQVSVSDHPFLYLCFLSIITFVPFP